MIFLALIRNIFTPRLNCDILCVPMTTIDWFGDLINVLFLMSCALNVLRKKWYQTRPILTTYILILATTWLVLIPLYLLQNRSSHFQYAVCRIYGVMYPITEMFIYSFSIAVLYEFLFHMAGNKAAIRKVAVIGFAITMGLTIYVARELMQHVSQTSNRLMDAATFFGRTTALSLLISGLFVFAIKSAQALYQETNMTIALGAITCFDFTQALIAFMLRGHIKTAAIAGQVISISFAVLLYVAVRNGPALENQASDPIVA